MHELGHVYVAYTQQTTGYLMLRRMDFSGGVWTPLPTITIYDGAESRQPSVVFDAAGDLRVAWTAIVGGMHSLHTKASVDSGATWGSGPSDPGDSLTAGGSSAFVKLVCDPLNVHALYTNGGLQFAHRAMSLSSGVWGGENVLGTGFGLEAEFDAAVASDNRLAVVWNYGELKYREYDGALWGPVATLDSNGGISPQLRFADTVPVVIYLSSLAAGQKRLLYTTRQTGIFVTPTVLDKRGQVFDSVVLYDSGSATFADMSSAAADAITADLYHPASSVLMQNPGDALYAGLDQPFRFLRVLLSTVGASGSMAFSYWDGSTWQAFVPDSGVFAFDALDAGVVLWEDANDIPADWQKKPVNGVSRFWVKAEVVSAFTTAPVGSRLTSVSDWRAITVRR